MPTSSVLVVVVVVVVVEVELLVSLLEREDEEELNNPESTTSNGQCLQSDFTIGSDNLRPINRFASNTVHFGYIAHLLFAESPTTVSLFAKHT